jgi:hypothetical protein
LVLSCKKSWDNLVYPIENSAVCLFGYGEGAAEPSDGNPCMTGKRAPQKIPCPNTSDRGLLD